MVSEEQIKNIIGMSRDNVSIYPVTTARYQIEVVMNEEDPNHTKTEAMSKFSDEFQRALDHGFFADLRYDAMTFEVVSREVLDVAPPGDFIE